MHFPRTYHRYTNKALFAEYDALHNQHSFIPLSLHAEMEERGFYHMADDIDWDHQSYLIQPYPTIDQYQMEI